MILEANIYDNFNPNELNILDFPLPGGAGKVTRPIPKPKARLQVLEYELWETGYKYTSSALFSSTVEIGDVVEVLQSQKVPLAIAEDRIDTFDLSFVYVVIDVDENNRATLKNYFWAAIDGMEIPTKALNSTTGGILVRMIDPNVNQLMTHGFAYNSNLFKQAIKFNRKSDSTEMVGVAKDIFIRTLFQPTTMIRLATYNINGEMTTRNTVQINLASRTWERKPISTRIDEALAPAVETETVISRSKYNFVIVYVKTTPDGDTYKEIPDLYTIDDSGNIVNYRNYKGDGYDLPQQKIQKTMFFDEAPTIAQIRSEISPDTVIKNILFNKDPKLELYVNDLASVWWEGQLYEGYVADRVITPANDRLLFVEGIK